MVGWVGRKKLRWGKGRGGVRPLLIQVYIISPLLLCGLFLPPLTEAEKDHAQEQGDGVKYEYRNHLAESRKSFRMCGDRHDDVDGSADAGQKQDTAQYI